MRTPVVRLATVMALVLVATALRAWEANPAMAQTQAIGAWEVTSDPGLDGTAPEWQSILPVFLPTTAQQVTPPMGGGTVETVAVRAVHWEDRLYVMLEWADLTADRLTDRHETFTDAAAIQFPAEAGSEVPSICMGQADQAVNIWQWRGDQQEGAPNLPEGGYVDLYPSTDDLYFPAREAGNPLSQLSRTAVRNMVAGGFGTLETTDNGQLTGHGIYREGRWLVVFSRPFEASGDLQPSFDGNQQIDIAFAIWDGSKGERNGIKSVSTFARLQLTPEAPPRRAVAATDTWPAYTPPNPMLGVGAGLIAGVLIVLIAGWLYVSRRQRMRRVDDD